MKILITGTNGQLGQELHHHLSEKTYNITGLSRDKLDLANPDNIRQVLQEIKPDVIINAGAYTAVDKAESEPELADAINGKAAGILAEEAKKINSRLIHVSTDYVFDGTASQPYLETDETNPLGVYGKSKLAGEKAIEEVGGEYLILRTAWVYGVGGKGNFVKTMLRLGGDREEIRVVCDQIGSPTWTGDLAEAIGRLIELKWDSGIYHYTNSGVASWYDFAVAIFEEAKQRNFPLKVARVVPITTSEYPTPARRPAFSVLSSKKISAVLGSHPPHWRQSLRKMLEKNQ
ncbi:dTDP-4-dehydrorhamnose reductase [Ancylothrix sp. C2]|uniref:dTDP-4-dehydrorhamnose reductase n=1 Tax=Ancylothrix sp. D3o TaxID=2953691 RepID=UPI0021BA5554|nr:dTDP-4-dehydrorhamnose reductase [Ancylothrix sp. D3o]MCT7949176.1 dTDP-4-dehydrorhamnose reductase [Ancylothrix sp. D3o]